MKFRFLVEAKIDNDRFIDKFGKDVYDEFISHKQRIKNKNYSVDLTYHTKNTSIEDMKKILDDVSDNSREQELDYENKVIPPDNGHYSKVAENDEWEVWHPTDYIGSIYCARGGRWCTAGGYQIPMGKIKVSQAKKYFNEYTDRGIYICYAFNKKNIKDSLGISIYNGNAQCFTYEEDDEISVPPNLPSIKGVYESPLDTLDKYTDDDGYYHYNGDDINDIIKPYITKVIVDDGVASVGNDTFYKCYNLESITIPDSVKDIGYDAFYHCKNLTSISIPNSVTSIGKWAFSYCDKLTNIVIPDSVTSIGWGAFWGCENLTNIAIPSSVTIIGGAVFNGCDNLTIQCHRNSFAEEYAKKHKIKYEII